MAPIIKTRGPGTGASLPGFSMIELLIVGVVLTSLAALGGFAYQAYLADVRETLSKQQNDKITEQVDINVDLIIAGATSGLRSQGTGYPITEMSTCGDFLDALKTQLQDLKNPYDGSPAITFSSGYSWQQKRGKIRITCYKIKGGDISNGRACKMKDAGIMVTHFKNNCGGKCGDPMCEYPGGDCVAAPINGWVHGGQIDKFYGNVEVNNITNADNETIVNWAYATSVCPGYHYNTIPKEADY